MKKQFLALLSLIAMLAVGCRDDGLDRVGISGKVIYQGKPLEGAVVMFRPEFGPGSGADTKEDGTFTVDSSYGPTSGKCEVRIMKMAVPEGSEHERNVLPEKFHTNPKIVTFESGNNTLDLNLDEWE